MPLNSNPHAVRIGNEKIRHLADRAAQLYNFSKMLQAEGAAENWTGMFPLVANAADTLDDGSAVDGRYVMTNQDVRDFIADITSIVNFFEASSNAVRNRVLKIAVNPEKV